MRDHDTFEARLADALGRLADRAPTDVDPQAVAEAVGQRRSVGTHPLWSPPHGWARVAVALLVLGLLLATVGASLFLGSQRRGPLDLNESRLADPTAVADGTRFPEMTPIAARIVDLSSIEAVLGPFTWETFAGQIPQPNPEVIRGNRRAGYVYGGDDRGVFFSRDGLRWQNISEGVPDAEGLGLGLCDVEAVYGQWIACAGDWSEGRPSKVLLLERTSTGWAPAAVTLDPEFLWPLAFDPEDPYGFRLQLGFVPVQSGGVSLITGGAGRLVAHTADGSFVPLDLDYRLMSLLAVPDGGFVAFPDGVSGERAVASANGLTWEERGRPGFLEDTPTGVTLARQPDRLVALAHAADGTYTMWVSTDGATWTRQTLPVRYPFSADHRAIAITDVGLVAQWKGNDYVSIDGGRSWARIPQAPDPSDAVNCGGGGGLDIYGATADTWYRHGGNGCGRDMTVGRFGAP